MSASRAAELMLREGLTACRPQELDWIGGVAGEAFSRDPVWRRLFQPGARELGAGAFFRAAAAMVIEEGFLLRTREDGGAFLGFMDLGRFSMRRLLDRDAPGLMAGLLSATGLEEAMSLWGVAEAYDRSVHALPGADLYLYLFFSSAPWRGRGEGSKAMGALTRALDELGLSCCLSTHNPDNLPLYRHLGFRLLLEQESGRGDREFFLAHP